jgi:predicted transcriptional regulator
LTFVVPVRLDARLKRELSRIALEEDRKISYVIRKLLRERLGVA